MIEQVKILMLHHLERPGDQIHCIVNQRSNSPPLKVFLLKLSQIPMHMLGLRRGKQLIGAREA